MVTQADVDRLQKELEQMRTTLLRDRAAVRASIDGLIDRAGQLRDDAAGGKFEPAIASVHGLLISLRRGLAAQAALNATVQ
ncbi:MAG: hypothetical protein IT442_03855 [Phycisphaeraceae bacterium]|nr:hypothetical protein [Phycisphaeraceae bacterium]